MQSSIHKMAIFLASAQGPWMQRVFPCAPGGKAPATPNGFKDATVDLDQIDAWWHENPDYNLGIPCGQGMVVLDVDCHNEDGMASLQRLLDMIGGPDALDHCPQEVTPNNGIHYYLRDAADAFPTIRKFTQFDFPGIELRGAGSYVVIAPSKLDGKEYQWVPGRSLCTMQPGEVPSRLRHIIKYQVEATSPGVNRPYGQRTFGHVALNQDHSEGERNNALYKYGCDLRGRGYEEYEIVENCLDYNGQWCQPPLDEREVIRTAMSASRHEKGTRGKGQQIREGEFDNAHGDGVDIGVIMGTEYPPVRWLVDRVLAPGATQLVGMAKVGKSMFCLQLSMAIAQGKDLFGMGCRQGRVAYFALEDNPARIQRRALKMGYNKECAGRLRVITKSEFVQKYRDLSSERGYARLRALVEQGKYDLVIIDVLSMAFPSMKQNEVESVTNAISPIQMLASEYDMAILIVDHQRKNAIAEDDHLNNVGGSRAKSATYDATITLERKRGETAGTLKVTSRDEVDFDMAVRFCEDTNWVPIDKYLTLGDQHKDIVDAILALGREASLAKIVDKINEGLPEEEHRKRQNVFSTMTEVMMKRGYIRRSTRGYVGVWEVCPEYLPPTEEAITAMTGMTD